MNSANASVDGAAICRKCGAACCQGPLVLTLTPDEVPAFVVQAAALGVTAIVRPGPDGSGRVRFDEHRGDRCPMLDARSWECRIYAERPGRCRAFPERPTEGCALSQLADRATT